MIDWNMRNMSVVILVEKWCNIMGNHFNPTNWPFLFDRQWFACMTSHIFLCKKYSLTCKAFVFSILLHVPFQAVGSTPAGLQYLITKSMLQASKALNLSLYLLLKADQASPISDAPAPILENNDNLFLVDDDANDIQNHPVMDRLNQLSQLTDKLKENVEDKTPGLEQQMHSLVKAAALMKGQSVESSDESSVEDEDDTEKGTEVSTDKSNVRTTSTQEDSDASSEASSDSDEEESEAVIQRRILTEAKFALRNQDIDDAVKSSKSRIRRLAPPSSMDYGDDAEEVSEKALEAGRKLASTMNSITQKSASNKGKKNQLINVEDEVDEYDQLQRGLAMMDDEFGVGSDAEDGGGSEAEDEGFGDEDGDDFYNKIKSKSLAKKEAKKQMYAVAPKYPRLDDEIEGKFQLQTAICCSCITNYNSAHTSFLLLFL